MEEDVRHVISTAAVALVLYQYAKVIQDAQVLLDDVLFSGACIIRSQDVQLFGRLGYLEHELEQPHSGLSGRRGALQKLHRGITTEKCLVLV